jgi:hypothetical protein
VNTAGPIATTIFVVTFLTVVGALISYAVFKARGRKKRVTSASPDKVPLQYFVEYELPEQHAAAAPAAPAATPVNRLWVGIALGSLVLTLALASVLGYLLLREPPAPVAPPAPGPALRPPPPAVPAVASAESSGEPGTTPVQPVRDGGPAKKKTDKVVPGVDRGPMPDFSQAQSFKPSLFVSKRMDRNRDGRIQPGERVEIHARVPQFVLVSVEEGGSAEGLTWLQEELKRHGIWGKATYFLTANYLPGRKNYLGGKVEEIWQSVFNENYGGLNGTTYAPGGHFWSLDRWDEENATVLEEISTRLRLPRNWRWRAYPWGSRSPFYVVNDVYFQSLKRLKYRILYDSSLVMRPATARPPENEVRDMPWPFTLDHALPRDVEYPGLPRGAARTALKTSGLWEMPVYAWYLRPPGGEPHWQPSVDHALWAQYGCQSESVNQPVVEDVVRNLKAHYRGNRAPFSIALRPQNYVKDEACKRTTLVAVLDRIDELIAQGYNIRFISMPDLILWMVWMSKR